MQNRNNRKDTVLRGPPTSTFSCPTITPTISTEVTVPSEKPLYFSLPNQNPNPIVRNTASEGVCRNTSKNHTVEIFSSYIVTLNYAKLFDPVKLISFNASLSPETVEMMDGTVPVTNGILRADLYGCRYIVFG